MRLSYEQYFLGLERREPIKLRTTVQALVRKYSGVYIKNVGTKFKFQQLIARYNVFSTHWDHILKQIEEGHYQRDVFKAKLHEKERDQAKGKVEKPKTSAPKKEDPFISIFNSYVEERKKNNEKGQIVFEKFKAQLEGQMNQIKTKTPNANVRLQVVSENGKTKIKAVSQIAKKT